MPKKTNSASSSEVNKTTKSKGHTTKSHATKGVGVFMKTVNRRSADRQREAARLMKEAAR